MISEKAVEAAAEGVHATMCPDGAAAGFTFAKSDDVHKDYCRTVARAALSAALPLLLEGKREGIARVIEPGAWGVYDQCVRDLDHPYLDQKVVIKAQIVSSLDRADRIIAMLTDGKG